MTQLTPPTSDELIALAEEILDAMGVEFYNLTGKLTLGRIAQAINRTRERMVIAYIISVHSGQLDVVGKILEISQEDPVLALMLKEADRAMAEEDNGKN
jgi:hypothetical protein